MDRKTISVWVKQIWNVWEKSIGIDTSNEMGYRLDEKQTNKKEQTRWRSATSMNQKELLFTV